MTNAKEDPEVMRFFEAGSSEVCESEAPVSEWTIRAWCRVMGDENPVYQDEAAAVHYGHGGVIAPPIMMHAYTLPGLLDEARDSPQRALRRRLAELGINSVAAVNYNQDYVTPIRLGDRLTRRSHFAKISDPKQTALGVGHFVDFEEEIHNQSGEVVGRQMVRTLFFKPGDRPGEKKRNTAASRSTFPNRVDLPGLEIPITTTLVIAGALATNDFEEVHHDRDVAQSQGMKDVFMNILTSSALATRLVTDWAGPAAKLRRIRTQLNATNYPGDTMMLTGWAESAFEAGLETIVHVRGINSIGMHIETSITIT